MALVFSMSNGHELTTANTIALGLRWVRKEAAVIASIFMPVAVIHPNGYLEVVSAEMTAGRGGHTQVNHGDVIVYPYRQETPSEQIMLRVEHRS